MSAKKATPVKQTTVAAKKVAPKKVEAPKKIVTETTSKNGDFEAKKIGANLIVTVKGTTERYPRKVTMEEGEAIMAKMKLYNKRPSKAKKEEIIAMLQPEASKAKKDKEVVVSKAKGVKQQIKKEIKKSKNKVDVKEQKSLIDQLESMSNIEEADINKLQSILDKFKKQEEKAPVAQVTEKPTRREAYRNGQRVYIYVNKAGTEVNEDGTPLTNS